MEIARRGVAAVLSRADHGAPDNMAIDMRLEDDRLPQSRHAILHHATAVAIHDADWPFLGQVLACRYQVLTVVDEEERPVLDQIIVDRMGISGEKLLDLRARLGIDDP